MPGICMSSRATSKHWPSRTQASASSGSPVARAVIAHEVGHALQDHERDPWMAVRQTIVPVAQFGSSIAPWLIIGGLIFNALNLAWNRLEWPLGKWSAKTGRGEVTVTAPRFNGRVTRLKLRAGGLRVVRVVREGVVEAPRGRRR